MYTKEEYIRNILEYTVGAPTTIESVNIFNDIVSAVSEQVSSTKIKEIKKKIGNPDDLLNYVKEQSKYKANDVMMGLYESTISNIVTKQTEKCYNSATIDAGYVMLAYSAIGTLLDNPQDATFSLDILHKELIKLVQDK